MFSISTYHLDFGTSAAMEHNGIGLGEEADLKALKYQICTTLN
jgi:hypothetical protein